MTGGVYSTVREMKLTRAVRSGAQPSQRTVTVSPSAIVGSAASGTKKRILMLPGGSSATTGRPAGTISPGRK